MGHARRSSQLAAIAAALLVVVGCTASRPGKPSAGAVAPPSTPTAAPRHLEGLPLAGPTGLRLLVASDPPQLLDVDRGTSRPVGGLPAGQDPFSVSEMGDGAVVAGDQQVFVLGRGATRASPVGRGGTAVGSLDGRGVWLMEHGRRCTLREVGLDGRARRPARRVPCTIGLLAETPLGLLAWTEPAAEGEQGALLDPSTGRVVARYPEVHGVVGDLVLWGGHEHEAGPLTLTDRRTGARHPVARPTPHGCWPSSSPTCPGGRSRARCPTSGCSTCAPGAGGGSRACP
jgi:hypothetical protein